MYLSDNLLILPPLLVIWTQILASWAVVGQVIVKIFFRDFSNLTVVVALVGATY